MANKRLVKCQADFDRPMFSSQRGVLFKYGTIIDTHQGSTNLEAWLARLNDENNKSPVLDAVFVSRMWNATSFLYSMESSKLVIKCARNYNLETRQVMNHGRIYVDLSIKGLSKTFGLPLGRKVKSVDLKKSEKEYENNKKQARKNMYQWRTENSTYLVAAKLPVHLFKYDFADEYQYMIALLNRVTGQPDAGSFRDWMYSVIMMCLYSDIKPLWG